MIPVIGKWFESEDDRLKRTESELRQKVADKRLREKVKSDRESRMDASRRHIEELESELHGLPPEPQKKASKERTAKKA